MKLVHKVVPEVIEPGSSRRHSIGKSPRREKSILQPSVVSPRKQIGKVLKNLRTSSALRKQLPVLDTTGATPNVMEFLTEYCPPDVLPKILAYAGPQKAASFAQVNRYCRDIMEEQWTWKCLCEELYKVRMVTPLSSTFVRILLGD